jgi:ubiquinone/menaquinone biosynthesis C-methylase UbiE
LHPSEQRVSQIFDDMREEYDQIEDLWYSWLFSRLHWFLALDVADRWTRPPRDVLDVGCGTGLQSFLYSGLGCQVLGVDISGALVEEARSKVLTRSLRLDDWSPFPARHPFVAEYARKTRATLIQRFGHPEPILPEFAVATALALPVATGSVDHVNCCGSVLSLVEDLPAALNEMARVLRPGGTFFLEVEARWNPDLIWPFVDLLVGGRLGFQTSLAEAMKGIGGPVQGPLQIEYPFGEADAPVVMPLTLHTRSSLGGQLRNAGMMLDRWRTIHSWTNLVPSTLLDSPDPSAFIRKAFRVLSGLEQHLPGHWPGCSLVVSGTRT